MARVRSLFAMLLASSALALRGQVQISFDGEEQRWTLSNEIIRSTFQITPDGQFVCSGIEDLRSGAVWKAPAWLPSGPMALSTSAGRFDASTPVTYNRQSVRPLFRRGQRLTIYLDDVQGRAAFRVELEMYPGQAVVRYRTRYTNLLSRRVWVRGADMLPWTFDDRGTAYRKLSVNQWVRAGQQGNFELNDGEVASDGSADEVQTGAHGQHCTWLAVRDRQNTGLFAGWEFDGRATATVRHFQAASYVSLSAQILRLNHPLDQNQEFSAPWAFLGSFEGDWDEAAWSTQKFVESATARPVPDADHFPYVVWDSWRYGTAIHEQSLRENARIAAGLGIELFVIDLGWARMIGDWREAPAKFPSGLRSLSDYVHSLGMKFGLHFPLAEAMADAPVLRENPDWTASQSYAYYDALSLCVGHRPVHDWVVQQAIRMIDEYGVDWIVQDGENMVKQCNKSTHTHDPSDSNWANSVEGINSVVASIQLQRPRVLWENCEDGGNMMTFNMVRQYVTSIAADDSGPLTTRKAVYGASFPFSTRFIDRYMPEEKLDLYTTRSFFFGGPWIFMNRLPDMSEADLDVARKEIQLYKTHRRQIREGRVLHLTPPPAEGAVDALQSLHELDGSSVIVVTRDRSPEPVFRLRPRNLNAEQSYEVTFANSSRQETLTGRQLMETGVRVDLPEARTAEIVLIRPQE